MLDFLFFILIVGLRSGPQLLFEALVRTHRENQPDIALTGREVARALLDRVGLTDVRVEEDGEETPDFDDYYDPIAKVVHLAPGVANRTSVVATAIAAHEVGHAMQDARDDPGFAELTAAKQAGVWVARGFFAALAISVASQALGAPSRVYITLIGFALAIHIAFDVYLRFKTLPTEWDASFGHALPDLIAAGLLPPRHQRAARIVLLGAALTYIAFAVLGVVAAFVFILDILSR